MNQDQTQCYRGESIMDKCYIILFSDMSYQIYNKRMEIRDFQPGARQFETRDNTSIIEIPEWISRFPGRVETRYIKEVGWN